MFYHLLYPLHTHWSVLNVFQYITFRAAYATITALLISFIFGGWLIERLRRLQLGETIRSDGPAHHQAKAGTPTMGGVLVATATVLPTLLWADLGNRYIQLCLLAMVWMGAIGFMDDYLKVVKKKPKGMVGRFKMLGQVSFGVLLYVVLERATSHPHLTELSVPFLKNVLLNLGWLYFPLVVLVVAGTSNAVNLTDGLDGLAIGLSAFVFLGFAAVAYLTGNAVFARYLHILYLPGTGEVAIFCSSVVGASLGFLWFNANPAQIFMGDTGSLALGGALGTVAILIKKELLLVIMGGMFVLEAASVMLQVASYRWRGGRRIFRMAPIHHHFELLGWPETRVVVRFWIIGILLLLLGLSTLKLQ